MQTINIKTWWCPECKGDIRDFDPYDETLLKKHFPNVPDMKPGECYNCRKGKAAQIIYEETKTTSIVPQSRVVSDDDGTKREVIIYAEVERKTITARRVVVPTCVKVTGAAGEPRKTQIHILDSQADLDAIKAQEEAIPPKQIFVGNALRKETNQEKERRVRLQIHGMKNVSESDKQAIYNEMMQAPNIEAILPNFRTETEIEKRVRIQTKISNLRIASAQEIADLKAKHEDK